MRNSRSSVGIVSSLMGPLAGVLLLLGIILGLTWSWWAGGILCVIGVLLVANNWLRRGAIQLLTSALHTFR